MENIKDVIRPLYYRILKLLRRLAAPIVTYQNVSKFFSENVLKVETINEIISRRPPYAMKPDYNDLIFLWDTVRKRKPKVILEFGSGWSTYVIASAIATNAAEGNKGFLYSLDHMEEWANITNDTMPKGLKEYCKVVYSQVKENEYEEIQGFVFSDIPDIIPNMVFLEVQILLKNV